MEWNGKQGVMYKINERPNNNVMITKKLKTTDNERL